MRRSRLTGQVATLLAAIALVGGCATSGDVAQDRPSAADESRARAHQSVGANHLREGRLPLAIRELRASEALNPGDRWTQLTLAEAYRMKGLNADAERHLHKALEIDPTFQDARLTLSGLYIQTDRYREAIEEAQILIDDPTFPQPWTALTNKGWALLRLERRAEAREALVAAIEYNERYWRAQLNLGILDSEEGKRIDAIERFERVIELAGPLGNAEANYRIAEIYISLGLTDEARRTASVLGHNYPGSPWYNRAYRLIYFKEPRDKLAKS